MKTVRKKPPHSVKGFQDSLQKIESYLADIKRTDNMRLLHEARIVSDLEYFYQQLEEDNDG